MRVMVIVKATSESEAGVLPSEHLLTEMGNFNEALVQAGIMKAGEGLKPSSAGKRVLFSGPNRTVTDGPFAETKELIAGYWLWEVESMEQALEWVKRCPNPMLSDSEIEIRPIYEMADFAEVDSTGSVAKQEETLANQLASQSGTVQPYLFFGGRADEALEFYQQTLGAKIGMVMRFSDSPDPVPEGMLDPSFKDKIMHSAFTIGAMTLFASDGCSEADGGKFDGFRLALSVPTVADAERLFQGLAATGRVDMPFGKTFWSDGYGMVTDQFGLGWMVMVAQA